VSKDESKGGSVAATPLPSPDAAEQVQCPGSPTSPYNNRRSWQGIDFSFSALAYCAALLAITLVLVACVGSLLVGALERI
jgi:hypothetical protein